MRRSSAAHWRGSRCSGRVGGSTNGLLETGRAVVAALHLVPPDDDVLGLAAGLPGTDLRSRDALHLASALQIGADLAAFVAYDGRLTAAAEAAGLVVAQPGS
ncbi:conserved protein of unknown function, putative toxin of TAS system [Blastococcus saxobsidens DD2]|uniref:PIN domain-containing protein n=1 Tax=Blastococcus saxobsidens (strain DD2) TaxID=1146883 RepID=H6RKB7_BLASD|nr:hypothetical protein [Blastococcus saxobsidens]CCG01140.1 conserved protein of unknown function, putative toxin of TAS system [Blastococcus saxobsidens DD2]